MSTPPSVVSWILALVESVPCLEELYESHCDEDYGSVLSIVFVSDLARLVRNSFGDKEDVVGYDSKVLCQGIRGTDVRRILKFLEDGMRSRDAGLGDVIGVGFLEQINWKSPAGSRICSAMGPSLREEARRMGVLK